MSTHAAKEFLVELIDDEDATARADQAYLDILERVAAERGYDASTDEIREVLRQMKGVDEPADRDVEVSGFAVPIGRDSLYSMGGGFEILGFLR